MRNIYQIKLVNTETGDILDHEELDFGSSTPTIQEIIDDLEPELLERFASHVDIKIKLIETEE